MGCTSCGSGDGKPNGCNSNGGCSSGSCNKMNTYDWLSDKEMFDPTGFRVVEVSFKMGSSKSFHINNHMNIHTGDTVVVEGDKGYNTGVITLSGELVRMQLKKKAVKLDTVVSKVLRIASKKDLEKLAEARELEIPTLVRARVIARNLGLNMKIGDIEYQGDKRKATFFYTAEGRVDFRELVKLYSEEFKIKIEMRQIGARQESARIGGLGSCGRELCCSTWLSKFKSVSTTAARYQNLSINQTKLSGQCGRLKCCLNYELDTYMDILKEFPKKVDYLKTKGGKAQLIKMDIFKGLMYYSLISNKDQRGVLIALDKERVKEIKQMNKDGELPENLMSKEAMFKKTQEKAKADDEEITFADVTGQIELPVEKKSRNKRRNNKRKPNNRGNQNKNSNRKPSNNANRNKKKPNPNTNTQANSNKQENTPANKPTNKPANKRTNTRKKRPNQNPNQSQKPNPNKDQKQQNTNNKNQQQNPKGKKPVAKQNPKGKADNTSTPRTNNRNNKNTNPNKKEDKSTND